MQKVKEWFWLFVKVLSTDIKELWQASKVVKEKKTLAELAEENKALGIVELPVLKEMRKTTCTHELTIKKQVWIKIAKRKYELRNRLICTKCERQLVSNIK